LSSSAHREHAIADPFSATGSDPGCLALLSAPVQGDLLRDWLYGGEVWHPLLMDLSLFILAVSGALWILLHG